MTYSHHFQNASSLYYSAARYQRYMMELQPYLVDNWDGNGAHAVSIASLAHFNEIVSMLPFDAAEPEIGADIDDGVVLRWMSDEHYLSITVLADGEIEAYFERGTDRRHVCTNARVEGWHKALAPFLEASRQDPWPLPVLLLGDAPKTKTYTSTYENASLSSEYVTA